ncbi:hypothetical protein BROOK1789C_1487 [Bathymodiolus brooksi thiotrophic gill symbiont]|nr:hypothetical protein BROOK1789B_896 [Bathymodiolus brooksi thiotrophic gill symbiont]CAB9544176.1 hypothetical protein BROOK1789C_1487 [Bathymodiolus brooksi thiotrophic gill symbiont]CAC9950756.1 hypothetical protein [uncultured Gammaproteobacteria bacterium]
MDRSGFNGGLILATIFDCCFVILRSSTKRYNLELVLKNYTIFRK